MTQLPDTQLLWPVQTNKSRKLKNT